MNDMQAPKCKAKESQLLPGGSSMDPNYELSSSSSFIIRKNLDQTQTTM